MAAQVNNGNGTEGAASSSFFSKCFPCGKNSESTLSQRVKNFASSETSKNIKSHACVTFTIGLIFAAVIGFLVNQGILSIGTTGTALSAGHGLYIGLGASLVTILILAAHALKCVKENGKKETSEPDVANSQTPAEPTVQADPVDPAAQPPKE